VFKYDCGPLQVFQLRALKDNYIYVLTAGGTDAIIIDPSEAEPALTFLQKHNLRLVAILNTHHHHDHVGGNLALRSTFDCPTYCSEYDLPRVPGADHGLADGAQVTLLDLPIQFHAVPGHTLGAIAFYLPTAKATFTGDTLFTLGCGRLFEGRPDQMQKSLSLFKAWPDDTRVFCGHEYTLQNGYFALKMAQDAKNTELIEKLSIKLASVEALLAAEKPTVPSLLGEEKALNPFLTARDLEEFTRFRHLKDEFKLEAHARLR
jgi:hydroxyacylglutathione hydrolase